MNGRRSIISILAVAVVAATVGVGAAVTGDESQWRKALELRSEALNKQHGLGRYARNPASAKAPQWLQALIIRSDALNREYKLGEYAPRS